MRQSNLVKAKHMLTRSSRYLNVRTYKKYLQGSDGSIAVLFGLSLPVLIGAAGIAVDYGRMLEVRSFARRIADETALLVANSDTTSAANDAIINAKNQLNSRLSNGAGYYKVDGKWIDGANYRLTISTQVQTTLVGLLPGMPKLITVEAVTTVNRVAPVYETSPPTLTQLSPEAADYNRVYFYCYSSDPSRQKEADQGRRGLTPIADNATPPTNYNMGAMPTCGKNEAPSYMLRNVRDARSTKSRWEENGSNTYAYYTDVTIDTGTLVQTRNMKGINVGTKKSVDLVANPILETILCDSATQCKPKSEGGNIPDRKTNRTPAVAEGSCEAGKLMYYGWEDRPGGDRDYDDIRLVITCPKQIRISDKMLRIVE